MICYILWAPPLFHVTFLANWSGCRQKDPANRLCFPRARTPRRLSQQRKEKSTWPGSGIKACRIGLEALTDFSLEPSLTPSSTESLSMTACNQARPNRKKRWMQCRRWPPEELPKHRLFFYGIWWEQNQVRISPLFLWPLALFTIFFLLFNPKVELELWQPSVFKSHCQMFIFQMFGIISDRGDALPDLITASEEIKLPALVTVLIVHSFTFSTLK